MRERFRFLGLLFGALCFVAPQILHAELAQPTSKEEWEAAAPEIHNLFSRFFTQRLPRLHAVAEDLTQECMVDALVHSRSTFVRGSYRKYLFAMAWNRLARFFRDEKFKKSYLRYENQLRREPDVPLSLLEKDQRVDSSNPLQHVIEQENRVELKALFYERGLKELPDAQKWILRLRAEGLGPSESKDLLKATLQQTKTWLFRGTTRLSKILEDVPANYPREELAQALHSFVCEEYLLPDDVAL